jgi:hypothetical protein
MKLTELAKRISATAYTPGDGEVVDAQQVYAGDRVSDLLNAAQDHPLLVSNLGSGQLIRIAELMDIPGICLVNAQKPDEIIRAAAEEHGTLLMVSGVGLFETCGRIFTILKDAERSGG